MALLFYPFFNIFFSQNLHIPILFSNFVPSKRIIMTKPTFYDIINEYPRDGIRVAEALGKVRKGLLDAMIIYEEFLYWRSPEQNRKKGEIYQHLAERYGYSTSSIRNKIAWMEKTSVPEEAEEVKYFFLHVLLKEKHKQRLLEEQEANKQNKDE